MGMAVASSAEQAWRVVGWWRGRKKTVIDI